MCEKAANIPKNIDRLLFTTGCLWLFRSSLGSLVLQY